MRCCLALTLLAACGSSPPPAPPPQTRVTAAIVPAIENRSVDVLFLIDDSINLDIETNLEANFPVFLNVLAEHGLPSLHIGVATSDLGTSAVADAQPAPTVGTGPGMCAGSGKGGVLQTSGSTLVAGRFIDDEPAANGGRVTNYSGTLADAFTQIASVGAAGCGFEQTLEAIRKALDNNPANVGFLRPEANLAVVVLTDEDDCSLEHNALVDPSRADLGPLQSFRCTRFGITCDIGGLTPDEMNEPGEKEGCHSNEHSKYLTHIADHEAFLHGLKPDPRMVLFAAIAGDPGPVDIELRAPIGSTHQIPALTHSCAYTDFSNSTEVADPAVRIAELGARFERNVHATACRQDLSGAEAQIARAIDSMMGSPCLTHDIALPADCTASDDAGAVTDFSIVEDAAMCPEGQHLRLQRGGTPVGATTVTCTPP
ncbi:MAG: hypothetical protein JO257_31805 [Deltaproteobacteria bacterium]|nr:hypothetical protein [Deltaproteobacteria bacterium]